MNPEIKPEPVERDELGHWYHSVVRQLEEESPYTELPGAEHMEFKLVAFDGDASEELSERYFENDDSEATVEWNPTMPEGDGWFLLSIYDTEDGPYACFARPKTRAIEASL